MFWRVCICRTGIRAKILLGKDPDKLSSEQQKTMNDVSVKEKYRIITIFKDDISDNILKKIINDNWMRLLYLNDNDIYRSLNLEIAEKYNAKEAMMMMKGYELAVGTEKPYCIEILINLKNIKDYQSFDKKYSGIDGAIELLYNADRVYTGSNPADEVLKWVKRLKLEKE